MVAAADFVGSRSPAVGPRSRLVLDRNVLLAKNLTVFF
jgi:hypothetical protein